MQAAVGFRSCQKPIYSY